MDGRNNGLAGPPRPNTVLGLRAAGTVMRIELCAAATVHWSPDNWRSVRDTPTRESGFGTFFVDLDTAALQPGDAVVFTLRWQADGRWQGEDYRLTAR